MNDPSSSVSSLSGYMPSATAASTSSRQPSAVTSVATAANKQSGTTLATVQDFPTCLLVCQCSDLNAGQAPGLPYYAAAAAAAGIQHQQVYSLEDMQYRYHLAAAG